MRRPMLAGNWKMNKLSGDLEPFFREFCAEAGLGPRAGSGASAQASVDVLFAVPYPFLAQAVAIAEPYGIRIAAQNVHFEASGAFTGEVSLPMLKDIGVTATLIGHSERRQYFGETDATVAKKTVAALQAGFMPIVCIGETLAEREAGETEKVVERQLKAVLDVIDQYGDLVIAYEPVWAIGTGRSATSQQAQEVHAHIRKILRSKFGGEGAAAIRLLYGGSASPANIHELLACADIDGALVGGASLKPGDFATMVRAGMSS